jgi:predicted PurR-regulated permease PerM
MRVLTPGLRLMLMVTCAFIIIGGLRHASDFLMPVVLAFFLAVLNAPFVAWLHRRGLPHVLAVILTLVVNLAVVGAFVGLAVNTMLSFLPKAPEYVDQMRENVEVWSSHIFDNPILTKTDQLQESKENFTEVVRRQATQFTYELPTGNQLLDKVASLTGTIFFVFIVMIFMMSESLFTKTKLEEIRAAYGPNLALMARVSSDIQRYLHIKTAVSLVTGCLVWLLTWAFGLEFPLLWGLLAFVLNYVPSIGSIIAAVPPSLLALSQLSILEAALIGLGFLCINMALGNIIEPMLLGRRFGISTLVVILSALFWGWLWGPIGMFVAIPLTMLLKVVLDNTDEFRWLSVAMGNSAQDDDLVAVWINDHADLQNDDDNVLDNPG